MIKFPLKQAALAAALAGMSVGAYAQTHENLGTVSFSSPTIFDSVVAPTTTGFSDTFLFSVQEPNQGIGASVVDVPLTVSGFTFDTVLATMSLVDAGANNAVGGGDDTVLRSVVLPSEGNSQDELHLTWEMPLSGVHYINVTGVTGGSEGGIYAGAIAAVPEPETYAMLLAGLGLMGAVVRRRGMRKTS